MKSRARLKNIVNFECDGSGKLCDLICTVMLKFKNTLKLSYLFAVSNLSEKVRSFLRSIRCSILSLRCYLEIDQVLFPFVSVFFQIYSISFFFSSLLFIFHQSTSLLLRAPPFTCAHDLVGHFGQELSKTFCRKGILSEHVHVGGQRVEVCNGLIAISAFINMTLSIK